MAEVGVEGGGLEFGADALGELGRAAVVGFFAGHDEFFAAEAADDARIGNRVMAKCTSNRSNDD